MTKGGGWVFPFASFSGGGSRRWLRPRRVTADPSAPLRFGRDDKGGGWFFPLRLFSGGGSWRWLRPRRVTADPSAPLRSGRDDKGGGWFFPLPRRLVDGHAAAGGLERGVLAPLLAGVDLRALQAVG